MFALVTSPLLRKKQHEQTPRLHPQMESGDMRDLVTISALQKKEREQTQKLQPQWKSDNVFAKVTVPVVFRFFVCVCVCVWMGRGPEGSCRVYPITVSQPAALWLQGNSCRFQSIGIPVKPEL